ncbi:MAG TPA: hypothetical protein VFC41_03495 [Anaerovoracaceae bacterium]|nr:hypothetical protein [Anaerovoracaceae bacterium]
MDLEKIYRMYNTEDILSSLIEMQLCPDRETKDIRIPVSEYFISNLIRYNIFNSKEKYTWTQFQTLRKYGQNCFNPSIANIISEAIKLQNANDETKNTFLKTSFMQLKNQVFRGDGYLKQLFGLSNLLYSPFDEMFKEKLGFTYTCCEKVMVFILKEYSLRVSKAFKEKNIITNIIKSLWTTLRNRQILINPSISAGYIFRISKEELYKEYGQEEIDSLIDFLGIKIGDSSLKPIGISDFKPLYERPFVDFGLYIYLPLPESTLMNLPKLFHYKFIASKIFEKNTVESYKTNRGNVVERLTKKYLKKFFDENSIYQSLKYPKKAKTFEADVTVQDGNISIFCECKSKILTLPTLKGDDKSLGKDINQAIGVAYEQAIRSIKWVESGGTFIQETDKDDLEILLRKTKYYFVLCVTVENFGLVPFEIYKYIQIDKDVEIVPLVINVYDLEIVIRECRTKEEFIGYLMFRKTNSQILLSVDELDVFGLYQKNGNVKIDIDADQLMALDFTQKYDRKYYLENALWIKDYDVTYHH